MPNDLDNGEFEIFISSTGLPGAIHSHECSSHQACHGAAKHSDNQKSNNNNNKNSEEIGLMSAASTMLTMANQSNPRQGIAELVMPKNHHFLWERLCKDGRAFYPEMMSNSESTATTNGTPIPNDPQKHREVWGKKDFELRFNKPEGFLVISRRPFPVSDTPQDWEKALSENCIRTDKREHYGKFMRALKETLSVSVKSKLAHYTMEKALESGIQYKGKHVASFAEVCKSWHEEEITREKCKRVFDLLYGCFEREDTVSRIEWEVMREHGVYFSNANDELNRTKVGGSVAVSSIRQLIGAKIRDTYRKPFTKGNKRDGHGVTVNKTNTNKAGGGRSKREKGEFIFEENVKGWHGPARKRWNEKVMTHFGPCVPKELVSVFLLANPHTWWWPSFVLC